MCCAGPWDRLLRRGEQGGLSDEGTSFEPVCEWGAARQHLKDRLGFTGGRETAAALRASIAPPFSRRAPLPPFGSCHRVQEVLNHPLRSEGAADDVRRSRYGNRGKLRQGRAVRRGIHIGHPVFPALQCRGTVVDPTATDEPELQISSWMGPRGWR